MVINTFYQTSRNTSCAYVVGSMASHNYHLNDDTLHYRNHLQCSKRVTINNHMHIINRWHLGRFHITCKHSSFIIIRHAMFGPSTMRGECLLFDKMFILLPQEWSFRPLFELLSLLIHWLVQYLMILVTHDQLSHFIRICIVLLI